MIDDIDLNEVFGVKADEATGEKETEAADPSDAEDSEGEKDSAPAEQDESDVSGDDESPAPEQGKKQSKEENARFAAARRKADAEVDKRVKDALDSRFARMGMTDPYTQQTIKTAEQFDAYLSKLEEERRESMANKAGMSKEEFTEYIDSQPEVREARAAKEQAKQQAAQAQIAEEIKEISKLDPSIHEIGDIAKSENAQAITELVNRGYRLIDAFKIANFDRLREIDETATAQRAYNSAASKSHLTPTKARGQGMIQVPKETVQWYKMFNPKMSDAEIQKDYNKYIRDNGG